MTWWDVLSGIEGGLRGGEGLRHWALGSLLFCIKLICHVARIVSEYFQRVLKSVGRGAYLRLGREEVVGKGRMRS